jgi:pentatricopeptide repeat protein
MHMLRARLPSRHGQSITRLISTQSATSSKTLRPVWSLYEKQTNPHILKLYKATWKETGDPIWPFIIAMKGPRSNRLTNLMVRNTGLKLSSYIRWRKFLDSAGLVEVASRINGTSDTTKFPSVTKIPTWVMGYALTFRVTDSPEARAAVELVIAHILSGCSPTTVPVLLILSVHVLADHQVIDPLGKIVELFLDKCRLPSQYGFFLQALSRFPPSLENNAVISVIIEKMYGEGGVPEDIYVSLLKSNSSSIPLAQRLERLRSVTNTKITPRLAHAFFRVYTRSGATTLAIKHLPSVFQLALLSPSGSPTLPNNSAGLRSKFGGSDTCSVTGSSRSTSPSESYPALVSPSTRSWTSLIDFFSRSSSISADQLVALFNRIRMAHPPTTVSFTVLMRALVSRGAYQRAIETWHEMLAEGHPIDIQGLSTMIEACTLARKHLEAFYLLEVVAKKGPHGDTAQPTADNPYPRIQLTTTFLATFMRSLARSGRPDVAFVVWDYAELLYGVTPDTSVLNVLLETAQTVVQFEGTFAGFWANLRAKRSSSHPDNFFSRSSHSIGRDEVVKSLRLTLERKKHKPTGLWGDVPAWQKAIKIFYHAVLGNNPELLHIPPPVIAIRSSVGDIHSRPWIEFIRSVQGPSPVNEAFRDVDVNSPASLARLGLYPLQAYPTIKPTKTTFHNLIHLLGTCGQASQIPTVLTWMKELQVTPFHRTTAMALIFWAEVSLRAPLFEQFGGEGEYTKLLKWLEAWVGKGRMPGQDRMTRMSKVIAKAREGRGKTGGSP